MKNPTRFIANRLSKANKQGQEMSRPAVKIASLSMIIGLSIMILSVAIVLGFKREVRNQIIGFGGHIQISAFGNFFNDNTDNPISVDTSLITRLNSIRSVKCSQPVAHTAAMIKTDTDFKGIILKGVDSLYNWDFFQSNLIAGKLFIETVDSTAIPNGALISKSISMRLGLGVGDRITLYFFKDRLRARKLTITGIYHTSFAEYNDTYIITDAATVQRLNKWSKDQFSSIELLVNDFSTLTATSDQVFLSIGNQFSDTHPSFRIQTIEEIAPTMFDWLEMLNINTIIILILMILVSGFCMISGLLIIILERRETIGILKALGANNFFIRKIFIWHSVKLILNSMAWGNAIALTLIFIQWQWHIIPLDPSSYYVDHVPVFLNLLLLISLNIAAFIASFLMMIAPTYLATQISPAEAMKAD